MGETKTIKISIPYVNKEVPRLAGDFSAWAPAVEGTVKDEKVYYTFKTKESKATFKFVYGESDWRTNPKFETIGDEHGNLNNFFVVDDYLSAKTKKSVKKESKKETKKETKKDEPVAKTPAATTETAATAATEEKKEETPAATTEATPEDPAKARVAEGTVNASTSSLDSKSSRKSGFLKRIIGSMKRK